MRSSKVKPDDGIDSAALPKFLGGRKRPTLRSCRQKLLVTSEDG
jgi:hypothetical protein